MQTTDAQGWLTRRGVNFEARTRGGMPIVFTYGGATFAVLGGTYPAGAIPYGTFTDFDAYLSPDAFAPFLPRTASVPGNTSYDLPHPHLSPITGQLYGVASIKQGLPSGDTVWLSGDQRKVNWYTGGVDSLDLGGEVDSVVSQYDAYSSYHIGAGGADTVFLGSSRGEYVYYASENYYTPKVRPTITRISGGVGTLTELAAAEYDTPYDLGGGAIQNLRDWCYGPMQVHRLSPTRLIAVCAVYGVSPYFAPPPARVDFTMVDGGFLELHIPDFIAFQSMDNGGAWSRVSDLGGIRSQVGFYGSVAPNLQHEYAAVAHVYDTVFLAKTPDVRVAITPGSYPGTGFTVLPVTVLSESSGYTDAVHLSASNSGIRLYDAGVVGERMFVVLWDTATDALTFRVNEGDWSEWGAPIALPWTAGQVGKFLAVSPFELAVSVFDGTKIRLHHSQNYGQSWFSGGILYEPDGSHVFGYSHVVTVSADGLPVSATPGQPWLST